MWVDSSAESDFDKGARFYMLYMGCEPVMYITCDVCTCQGETLPCLNIHTSNQRGRTDRMLERELAWDYC